MDVYGRGWGWEIDAQQRIWASAAGTRRECRIGKGSIIGKPLGIVLARPWSAANDTVRPVLYPTLRPAFPHSLLRLLHTLYPILPVDVSPGAPV